MFCYVHLYYFKMKVIIEDDSSLYLIILWSDNSREIMSKTRNKTAYVHVLVSTPIVCNL